MPFKSQAQRRKFAQLLVEGKISPETYEEWNRETGSKRLPQRVKPKIQGDEEENDRGEPRQERPSRARGCRCGGRRAAPVVASRPRWVRPADRRVRGARDGRGREPP